MSSEQQRRLLVLSQNLARTLEGLERPGRGRQELPERQRPVVESTRSLKRGQTRSKLFLGRIRVLQEENCRLVDLLRNLPSRQASTVSIGSRLPPRPLPATPASSSTRGAHPGSVPSKPASRAQRAAPASSSAPSPCTQTTRAKPRPLSSERRGSPRAVQAKAHSAHSPNRQKPSAWRALLRHRPRPEVASPGRDARLASQRPAPVDGRNRAAGNSRGEGSREDSAATVETENANACRDYEDAQHIASSVAECSSSRPSASLWKSPRPCLHSGTAFRVAPPVQEEASKSRRGRAPVRGSSSERPDPERGTGVSFRWTGSRRRSVDALDSWRPSASEASPASHQTEHQALATRRGVHSVAQGTSRCPAGERGGRGDPWKPLFRFGVPRSHHERGEGSASSSQALPFVLRERGRGEANSTGRERVSEAFASQDKNAKGQTPLRPTGSGEKDTFLAATPEAGRVVSTGEEDDMQTAALREAERLLELGTRCDFGRFQRSLVDGQAPTACTEPDRDSGTPSCSVFLSLVDGAKQRLSSATGNPTVFSPGNSHGAFQSRDFSRALERRVHKPAAGRQATPARGAGETGQNPPQPTSTHASSRQSSSECESEAGAGEKEIDISLDALPPSSVALSARVAEAIARLSSSNLLPK